MLMLILALIFVSIFCSQWPVCETHWLIQLAARVSTTFHKRDLARISCQSVLCDLMSNYELRSIFISHNCRTIKAFRFLITRFKQQFLGLQFIRSSADPWLTVVGQLFLNERSGCNESPIAWKSSTIEKHIQKLNNNFYAFFRNNTSYGFMNNKKSY